jgi:transposase
MDEILAAASGVHASEAVKHCCLYMYFFVGICVANLATYFRKDRSTIKRWVKAYNDGEGVARKVGHEIIRRTFNEQQINWILALIDKHQLCYLRRNSKEIPEKMAQKYIDVPCTRSIEVEWLYKKND